MAKPSDPEAELAKVREVLQDVASRGRTIAYSTLLARVGLPYEPDSSIFIGMLGDISVAEYEAGRGMLSVIVVHKTGDLRPGKGFFDLARDLGIAFVDEEALWSDQLKLVYRVWKPCPPVERAPTSRTPSRHPPDANATDEQLVTHLLTVPASAGQIYRLSQVRGSEQKVFRNAILAAYERACAVCGLAREETLEAAHIKPYVDCNEAERMAPTNGLLLCAVHHRMFDAGTMSINHVLHIRFNPPTSPSYTNAVDKALVLDFHGKPLRLPSHRLLWPDMDHFAARRATRRLGHQIPSGG